VATPHYLKEIHSVNLSGASRTQKAQQFILNFFGSILGWFMLGYFLAFRLDPLIYSGAMIEWKDLFVLLIAFYGITSYLPYILLVKAFDVKGFIK